MMLGLLVIALIFLSGRMPLGQAIGYSFVVAFFPSGWSFLGRYFTPGGGYFGATARWMNLALHAAAAAMLGIIVGPIYLFNAWRQLAAARQAEKTIGER